MKKAWLYSGQTLWFFCKIAVYLLVTYSICVSLAVTYGVFWGYKEWTNLNQQVLRYQEGAINSSTFMENHSKMSQCSTGIEQKWIDIEHIPTPLKKSVLAVEDASFYVHPGIDLEAILSAMETNRKRNKKAFGGSTLTQQLAKNLFLTKEKSWVRKGKELGFSILMEKHLGKDRIFELYLNLAQWGPCQFGCEAAAEHFYKKSCEDLNLPQSINLAAILANPNRYHPEAKKSKLMKQRRALIYENLYTVGYLKKDTVKVDSVLTTDSLKNQLE